MVRRTSLRLQSQGLQSQVNPEADSPQTTRTNSGRNRLGCHTCRIRRKKCDERKDPSGACDTCLRLNIECLGWGPSRPAWCSNEKELNAFKESTKRKVAMRRGGLDAYNDQSSEDFVCDTSSGSSGAVDIEHSPNLSFSSSPGALVSLPLPDLELSAAVVDALQTQQFVTLACELAISTGVSSPLLDSLRQMAELAYWNTNQVSATALDTAEFQLRVQVIFDEVQNSILPMPYGLSHFNEISSSLFEVNRTACLLLLNGICEGLHSSSPGLAECVKEVQTQVNLVSFLQNVLPEQYLFAACIAKSFATHTEMSFMNSLVATINDQTVKTTAHLLLTMAHTRDAVW